MSAIDDLIKAAKDNPECFKCHEPITEFGEVRIVTVWADGVRRDVWVHASHAGQDSTIRDVIARKAVNDG